MALSWEGQQAKDWKEDVEETKEREGAQCGQQGAERRPASKGAVHIPKCRSGSLDCGSCGDLRAR